MTQENVVTQNEVVVYFDGACPVCSSEIAYYRRQPGADTCQWIDASSCADAELGPDLTRAAALKRFHVRRPDGTLADGARGFGVLWQALPRTAWLGHIVSFGPMPVVLNFAYRVFLAVRPLWRKTPSELPATSATPVDTTNEHAGEPRPVQSGSGAFGALVRRL